MLGWSILIFRQIDGRSNPATAKSHSGPQLATWLSGVDGTNWIDNLVEDGNAIYISGNGYPSLFTATAEYLIPNIKLRPFEKHILKPKIDEVAIAECQPNEWLLVEVWDES